MEIHIRIIRDIMSVIRDKEAIVHIIDGEVLVSHKYCGHDIVAWFCDNGMVRICKTKSLDINYLKRQYKEYGAFCIQSHTGNKAHKAYCDKLNQIVNK